MKRPLILIGYLGKDPEIRQTRVRTYRGKRLNRVAQRYDRYEFTTRPRDFIVVSLATHDEKGAGQSPGPIGSRRPMTSRQPIRRTVTSRMAWATTSRGSLRW